MYIHIKSCPFCGAKAKVKKFEPDCVDICFSRYYVACTSDECGAEMGKGEYSPEDAIEKWNKRGVVDYEFIYSNYQMQAVW